MKRMGIKEIAWRLLVIVLFIALGTPISSSARNEQTPVNAL